MGIAKDVEIDSKHIQSGPKNDIPMLNSSKFGLKRPRDYNLFAIHCNSNAVLVCANQTQTYLDQAALCSALFQATAYVVAALSCWRNYSPNIN
eukprot:2863240-Amphidinium_carterae.1